MSTPASTGTTTESPEAPPVSVDPGQVIRVNAHFPDKPKRILFSYLAPQCDLAVHDAGTDDADTLIQHDGNLYHYSIDTRGMRGGLGWWYFYSEDDDSSKRRAKVGRFLVREVPRALLDRDAPRVTLPLPIEDTSGFAVLGAESWFVSPPVSSPSVARQFVVGAGVGIIAGLAISLL